MRLGFSWPLGRGRRMWVSGGPLVWLFWIYVVLAAYIIVEAGRGWSDPPGHFLLRPTGHLPRGKALSTSGLPGTGLLPVPYRLAVRQDLTQRGEKK